MAMRQLRKLMASVRTARNLSTITGFQGRHGSSNLRLVMSAAGLTTGVTCYLYSIRSQVASASKVSRPEHWMADPITDMDVMEQNGNAMKYKMEKMIMKIQADFCKALEAEDGSKFTVDRWMRKKGGGGITCVMQDGKVLEKAGVNISVVHGLLPAGAVQQMRARGKMFEGKDMAFSAVGISSVIHPRNPHAPTVHFNYRYFEVIDEKGMTHSWFGGGTDLTPSFIVDEDVTHFHSTLKKACDLHDKKYYPDFKAWCDKYFYIPHRGESRGVGGIFFDDLEDKDKNQIFNFVSSCAETVVPCYIPILHKNKDKPYTPEQRRWQLIRRGRYAEFNLVYDRGTKFGLHTPEARIESILMSLPLNVMWEYCHSPESDEQQRLVHVLNNPQEWV